MIYLYLGVSILGFLCMMIDKRAAIQYKYRIPEKRLLTIGILFGSYGIVFGMILFHHKIRKFKFYTIMPLCIVLHTMLYYRLVFC